MGIIKSHSDRQSLQQAGKITQTVLNEFGQILAPGVSTIQLEKLANQLLSEQRSTAPFKSYHGFNHAICVSINEEIVNGPPSRERTLQAGDIVSIATAAEYRGIHAKAARTFYIQKDQYTVDHIPSDIKRLLQGTDAVLQAAPQYFQQDAVKQAGTLNRLLEMIPETAQAYHLTILQGLGGTGIGKKLHDYPATPNHPEDLDEIIPLQLGLCFTIMPMFSLGLDPTYHENADGWTLVTNDGSLSAHFADTFLVSEQGLINITRPEMR